jgi:hypothetical protein
MLPLQHLIYLYLRGGFHISVSSHAVAQQGLVPFELVLQRRRVRLLAMDAKCQQSNTNVPHFLLLHYTCLYLSLS